MKFTALVFLGVATGISIAYAEAFKAPELEPSITGVISAPELFPSQEYASAFRHGAHHACEQPERATQRYANMLQANCVAADMGAGMDWTEISRHCLAAPQRSALVRQAEEICAALRVYSGFRLARDGQSDEARGCIPLKRCLWQ